MTTAFMLALIGYIALGTVSILDKFILSKSVTNPFIYTFYSTVIMLPALFLIPFVTALQLSDIIWATFSGITFGLGILTMFFAIQKEEASHIAPFIGAMVSIFTFLLSSILLGEILGGNEKIGVVILIVGGLLLSFQDKGGSSKRFHNGFLWAILSGLIFGFSHVTAKYIYNGYPFLTGLVWTKGTVALVAIALLCFPSVFRGLFRPSKEEASPSATPVSGRSTLAIVGIDKILGVVGALLIQYAISLGSVTVINAMSGIQYVFVFAGVIFMTTFFPHKLSEYFTRKELVLEAAALLLVVIGSAFFFI